MSAWTSDELQKIDAAQELELTTLRSDGTPRKAVTIWAVRNGDDVFIRSWRGQDAAWFRNTQARPKAHIQTAGLDRDVELSRAGESLNDEIDSAYRTKYTPVAPSYVEPMLSPQARSTTLKLDPRNAA